MNIIRKLEGILSDSKSINDKLNRIYELLEQAVDCINERDYSFAITKIERSLKLLEETED